MPLHIVATRNGLSILLAKSLISGKRRTISPNISSGRDSTGKDSSSQYLDANSV